jgi:hypothetical protein
MRHPRGRHLKLKGPQFQNLSGFSPLSYVVRKALGHKMYQNKWSSEVEPSTGPNFGKAWEAEGFTEQISSFFQSPWYPLDTGTKGKTNLSVSKNKMSAGLDIIFFKMSALCKGKIPCSKAPSNYTTKIRPLLYAGESEPAAYGMPIQGCPGNTWEAY